MIARSVAAVVRARLLELGRTPAAVILAVAFALLAASFADVASPSRVQQIRQASSWLASAAGALLSVAALLIPVSGGAPRTRLMESRVMGRTWANLGHAVAALLFLVFLAGLLALVAWVWITVEFENPDARAEGVVLRSVLYRNAGPITLRSGDSWEPGEIETDASGALRVELSPRIRFPAAGLAESGPAGDRLPPTIELSWRDGPRLRTRRLAVGASQPIVEVVDQEGPPRDRRIAFSLRLVGRGVEVGFDPGGVSVLGVRRALLPSLLRSFLVAACLAAVVAAGSQWFSNFVGPPIAVAAVTTLVILTGAAKAAAPVALPAVAWAAALAPDAVGGLRRGHELGWPAVACAFVASAAAIGLASLAAVHGPERSA